MKKFITKFFLIVSVCVALNAKDTNDTNSTEQNITNSQNTSVLDVNLSSILKQPKVEISEENKTAEKQKIVEILTSDDKNKSKEELVIVELIAEKAVKTSSTQKVSDKENLNTIVNNIKDINVKLERLKSTSDANRTNDEIKEIENSKNEYLVKIPTAITSQILDEKALIEYVANKKSLKEKIAANEKNKNSFKYIEANLQLSSLELTEKFYSTLLLIENLFMNGSKEFEVKKILQDSLLDIQIRDYSKTKEAIDTLKTSEENKENLNKLYSSIMIDKKTYEEILTFLNKNTNLLSGNALFTGLNLKVVIDYINDLSPFDSNIINLGKIIPILLIMVLLFSVRKFLANIIYFVFSLFIKDKEKSVDIKTQVIDLIKKPMGVLLIAYGVDICLSIFYYPNLVPIIFNNAFDIIFIILYSWLIVEIIDGYGIMIISQFAKKSSRKEVLNLVVKILYIIVFIVAFLLILARLGVNVSAIVASLGIGGLAVALATKDIIANLFASIVVLFDNSFSQGDWIVVGDIEGTVVETGLRKTTIRTFDNSLVFVPNSKIIDNSIVNWSRRKVGRQIKMYLGISYGISPQKLEIIINEIKQMLHNHPGIANPTKHGGYNDIRLRYRQNMVSLDDLAGYKNNLFVTLDKFADSSIDIMIYCFTKSVVWAEFLDVKQDVMLKIMEILNKNGATFAYPSQSIYLEDTPAVANLAHIKDGGDKVVLEVKKLDEKNDKNNEKNS